MLWRASEQSVRDAVRNAVALAEEKGFRAIAFPLIGAGSGGMAPEKVRAIMEAELRALHSPLEAWIVIYRKPR